MIRQEITMQVLNVLKEKAMQAQTQERELADKFHTLAGAVEEARTF